MGKDHTYLVVGGDSLVGGGLLRALQRRNLHAIATTRRRESVNERRVFLDFESETRFQIPPGVDYVFIIAAATNYERCEKDPLAYRINVEFTPRLVRWLLEQGVFVTFISTNSVFGGDRPWPQEDDPHTPGIPYAKQKAEAESAIQGIVRSLHAEERFNVVRLTKILDRATSPLPSWFQAWDQGIAIQPFSDLMFAPMSVRFVGEALATVGALRIPGALHLSGAQNVSYVDLAGSLASLMGISSRLIEPTTADAKGVHIPFKPRYSGIGMKRTTELTGLLPQSLADVAIDILQEGAEGKH